MKATDQFTEEMMKTQAFDPSLPRMTLLGQNTRWDFQLSVEEAALLSPYLDTFTASKIENNGSEISPSRIELASEFLRFLLEARLPRDLFRSVVMAFEDNFLFDHNIHTIIKDEIAAVRDCLLQTYYASLSYANINIKMSKSGLFSSAQDGDIKLYAIFGGQGPANSTCLDSLRRIYSIYCPLVQDLIDSAAVTLMALSSLPKCLDVHQNHGFDIKRWLDDPTVAPYPINLASTPISFPLITLLGLAQYCITCKAHGRNPGEMLDLMQGVTGHSQGIIAAAAIAHSESWEKFYVCSKLAIEIAFWVGYECDKEGAVDISMVATKDSVDAGEGLPSPMLSIRGLEVKAVRDIVDEINAHLEPERNVHLGIINSRHNVVLSGPPSSLRSVNLRLRQLKVSGNGDQARVPFYDRKPSIFHQFLPISAAFHSPYLLSATDRILKELESRSFPSVGPQIELYHTETGECLRKYPSKHLVESLIRMITVDHLDWPKATSFPNKSYVLDFGPGSTGSLVHEENFGAGVQVAPVLEWLVSSKSMGTTLGVFSQDCPLLGPNWGKLYGPKLLRHHNGQIIIHTKMSSVLGCPPIMVAGMTPTTAHWDFVAAIMNSGYHAELGCGAFINPESLENAIHELSNHIQPGRGISCNVIYADPKSIAWQIPLIRRLIRKGYPIHGITIGAGIPSIEIVEEYITSIGLKYLSLKPGSAAAILEVISISQKYSDFQIILQWTGGRSGGHHSFEDFHKPILATYGSIRECPNIVLIAGGGFGSSDDTYKYLTGEWSQGFGYPAMPFDGILLGSRMMVAKEAHTSRQAKALIVEANGVPDSHWHLSYKAPVGGVVTVISEMGQPIHVLATRGMLLWKELDETIFNINDPVKRLVALQKRKTEIVTRLTKDFQKPWFAVNSTGEVVDLEQMTYLEMLQRLVALMYVDHQRRWINESYKDLTIQFARRSAERLPRVSVLELDLFTSPKVFLCEFSRCYPSSSAETLHPEDMSFFIGLCRKRSQKPVNFIPDIDENFETWFKKDSLWQAEDIDAVVGHDAQRVCIIHGPVAAQFSTVIDEPVKDILHGIAQRHIEMMLRDVHYNNTTTIPNWPEDSESHQELEDKLTNVETHVSHHHRIYRLPVVGHLPSHEEFVNHISRRLLGWSRACLAEETIYHGQETRSNPIRKAFVPFHGQVVIITYCDEGKGVETVSLKSHDAATDMSFEKLRMKKDAEDNIIVTLGTIDPHNKEVLSLDFIFRHTNELHGSKIEEEQISRRNAKIRDIYARLWLSNNPMQVVRPIQNTEFHGSTITLSHEFLREFTCQISQSGNNRARRPINTQIAPLDICIVVSWESLMKPLLSPGLKGDLLRLLHKSNTFEYYPNAKPLCVGDTLHTTSRVTAVTISEQGKSVEVVATIWRLGESVVKVTSCFLFRGSFSDHQDTFKIANEPDTILSINSRDLAALILSRKWFFLDNLSTDILGRSLLFKINSRSTYGRSSAIKSLLVTGNVYIEASNGKIERVGRIHLDAGPCQENPIMNFLLRHGSLQHQLVRLDNPGWANGSSWEIQMPPRNDGYARVSKDNNPIHVCPTFAGYAGLPGTITHGMYTSAAVREIVENAVGEADLARFRRYSTSFLGMVYPRNIIRVEVQHVAMTRGKMVIEIQAFNKSTNEIVLQAEAEIEQPVTAYLFTGQGSQNKGMGMDLYKASNAARDCWDRGDRYFIENYGFSILNIVQNNPKELTVYFGGIRGRKIRENYLSIKAEEATEDGRILERSIIKGLTEDSPFYKFEDERGLLYSTQFGQPAIILQEMAAFEDMKLAGLIQETAVYAGHSLGEYGALKCLADIAPIESLLGLLFYRGLMMQLTMPRNKSGRTDYSMVAVNPSKVSKDFTEDRLLDLVRVIAHETGVLLEVVNFNVKGQQYVCAGHLRALWVMGEVLLQMSLSLSWDIPSMISPLVSRSLLLSEVVLAPNSVTIPLKGIDVPFHSKFLRSGINSYRKFLEARILEENIDAEKLVGRWIANVMGRPFSLEKEYFEEAAEVTGSRRLHNIVEKWIEVEV